MDFNFYDTDDDQTLDISKLPKSKRSKTAEAKKYLADDGLINAVNIALLLNKPLLVTGEPGTGKTLLAYSVAQRFGITDPFIFETKSTSTARDLFYTYDSLSRFLHNKTSRPGAEADDGQDHFDGKEFITFNALGKAILLANRREDISHLIDEDFNHPEPCRSVVLIDEIDKAPRDFPNDLLSEIDNMYFKIPELQNKKVAADKDMFPIVIITSNSEKHLPDAFLRRCIYYDIPFPDKAKLRNIIIRQMIASDQEISKKLDDALDFFMYLRQSQNGLKKNPSTAELLEWVMVLSKKELLKAETFSDTGEKLKANLRPLIKTAEDQAKVDALVESWLNSRSKKQ